MTTPSFSPALFRFLRELRDHNDRDWFEANRARYEADVKAPMQAFILALDAPLRRLSRHYAADPRSSLFRIHRDTRFSRDKSPYKLHVGAQFRHLQCAKDVHAPGFYLQLEPGNCFAAAGIWHPDGEALRAIRARIVAQEKAWRVLRKAGLEVQGEALKRVPAGFPSDHPFADDLRLKDLYVVSAFTEKEACSPGFLAHYLDLCREGAPLVRFLVEALELPW
jgi:uncharacterized protein (TIGR02453 family)